VTGHAEAAELIQAWTQRLETGAPPRTERV
jgi:hypothetical protein